MSVLQEGSYYRILNSHYAEVDRTPYYNKIMTNLSFPKDIIGQYSNINHRYVFIQVVHSAKMQDLPSRPFRANVSGQF